MNPNRKLIRDIEAVLFMAPEGVTTSQLAQAAGSSTELVSQALGVLERQLEDRGVRLVENHGRYSLATAGDTAPAVERYLGAVARTELSKPALETLAIVAYKQPVTKSQIDSIRGVASDQTLKNLLLRGLVVESGRANVPGKPLLYRTSTQFLHILGLTKPEDLPGLQGLGSQPDEA